MHILIFRNPIENIWFLIKRKLSEKVYKNLDEMIEEIERVNIMQSYAYANFCIETLHLIKI